MSEALNKFAAQQKPDENAVETVKVLCVRAKDMAGQIEGLEEALKAAKESYRDITEEQLPAALNVLGMKKFELEDGTTVTLNQRYFASLPKDEEKRKKALDKLREYGGTAIIKSEVSCRFPGTEHNLAVSVFEGLKADKIEDVRLDESVAPQTLAKFAKERIEAGHDTDISALGVFQHNRAEFKLPRKTKSKK